MYFLSFYTISLCITHISAQDLQRNADPDYSSFLLLLVLVIVCWATANNNNTTSDIMTYCNLHRGSTVLRTCHTGRTGLPRVSGSLGQYSHSVSLTNRRDQASKYLQCKQWKNKYFISSHFYIAKNDCVSVDYVGKIVLSGMQKTTQPDIHFIYIGLSLLSKCYKNEHVLSNHFHQTVSFHLQLHGDLTIGFVIKQMQHSMATTGAATPPPPSAGE